MNYALIENGIVTNVIWLYPKNVSDFPNAVPIGDLLAGIGDEYIDGKFYRNGELVMSYAGMLQALLVEKENIIAELDAALLDATYDNIMGGLE